MHEPCLSNWLPFRWHPLSVEVLSGAIDSIYLLAFEQITDPEYSTGEKILLDTPAKLIESRVTLEVSSARATPGPFSSRVAGGPIF